MPKYADIDNDSSVVEYGKVPGGIGVTFRGGVELYYYDEAHVDKMWELGKAGDGLNAYINQNKPEYSREKRKGNE